MAMTINGTNGLVFNDSTVLSSTPINFGFKNRIINGAMATAQRATTATVTASTAVPTASTGYPCVDRFFVYSTGASVTAAQVAGSGATQYRLQVTGAASVATVGIGQRIEQKNSYDLAGSTATLSLDLANSLLTSVTWTASYATTADTFGTIGTPTKTQIATGTFTVTSTVTNYSTQITIPAAATTGIEILLTVGAQLSGTFTVGNVQLEKGGFATAFDTVDIGRNLIQCQRYFTTLRNEIDGVSTAIGQQIANRVSWPARMRIAPTLTASRFASGAGVALTTAGTLVTVDGASFTVATTGVIAVTYAIDDITATAEL